MGLQYDFKPNHLTDEGIQAELRRLEEKHGMSTAQFLTRYNRGLLGHAVEFIDWAGLAAVAQGNAAPQCPHSETLLVVAAFTLRSPETRYEWTLGGPALLSVKASQPMSTESDPVAVVAVCTACGLRYDMPLTRVLELRFRLSPDADGAFMRMAQPSSASEDHEP